MFYYSIYGGLLEFTRDLISLYTITNQQRESQFEEVGEREFTFIIYFYYHDIVVEIMAAMK